MSLRYSIYFFIPILFFLLCVQEARPNSENSQTISYIGQESEILSLKHRYMGYENVQETYEGTCTRQVATGEEWRCLQVISHYERVCSEGRWEEVCRPVRHEECRDVSRTRRVCERGPD